MERFLNDTKDREGSVLIIALFMLVFLTLIGIAATTTTQIETQIAGNEKLHKVAFYAAEAGIEAGRAALNQLKEAHVSNWDNLLTGSELEGQSTGVSTLDAVIDDAGGRNVGSASFTLAVRDNDDLDGNTNVDTDNILILTSTGTYGNATVQIEARVRYTGGGDEYAQEHYDASSSGRAASEDTAVAQNIRW
ncbi:MAG: hypothetical protein JRJ29_22020 [Deltaproteobacteria bacterium]|nr:hypothetical protein [Deltaproteobacteria bacterium]